VRIGPIVDTSQTPLPGSEPLPPSSPPLVGSPPSSPPLVGSPPSSPPLVGSPPSSPPLVGSPPSSPPTGGTEGGREARIKVGIPIAPTYDAETRIDIFSGPSFKFERRDDQLHVHFLDWHRRWSHSLTLAAAVGVVAGLLFGKWAGVVTGLGFAGHVLEDQLGFMGSNLFYPFTKGRSTGLQLLRSGDAIPNFLTVWTAVALILFNLDR